MAEDGDPVVHEADVYLSKSLADSLYIFQENHAFIVQVEKPKKKCMPYEGFGDSEYPVRPAHLPYDSVDLLSAKVKPKQQKVELEFGVNSTGPNYSVSKGEQLALNVDGSALASPPQSRFFRSDVFDKQVLSSMSQSVDPSKYAIGVLKDGELHLTPVHGLVQLKPNFLYLDQADMKTKSDNLGFGDTGENSQDEEEEAKAVTVKFARPESEEAKARRMASYNYVQGRLQQEAWVKMDYHLQHSDRCQEERKQLFANKTDEISEFQMDSDSYINLLMPRAGEQERETPSMPTNVLSLAQLRTLPLSDQVRALLINAKTIRMSQLMSLLPNTTEPTAALRCLQQVAMLVQGCWVVKSDILYPKDSVSPISGISAEAMCRARDYVMWKFTQSRCVIRKEVSSVVKLPAEDMKEILEHMSRMRASVGWEFLYSYDREFTDKYPEIIQRQKMVWEAKYQTLSTQFKIPKDGDKKIKDLSGSSSPEKPKRRRRTSSKSRGRTLSGRSMSDQSDTDIEMSDKLAVSECNKMAAESMEVTDYRPGLTLNGDSTVIKTEPIEAEENCVKPGLPPLNLFKELTEFTRDKLHSKCVLSKTELKRFFTLFLTQCPADHVLRCGVSEKMLEDSVFHVGGDKLEYQGCEPIYIVRKKGDDTDKWREILLDMFKTTNKTRVAKVKQKFESVLEDPISDAACRQLLKEYCESKSGNWFIKGTADLSL